VISKFIEGDPSRSASITYLMPGVGVISVFVTACLRITTRRLRSTKKALTINPVHFSARTRYHTASMLSGQEAKAGAAAKEVLSVHPNSPLRSAETLECTRTKLS